MKLIVIKSFKIVVLSLISVACYGQENIKYVSAKNGLNLRDSPDLTGNIIGSVQFNEKLYVKDELQLDTIEFRVAHWVRVITDSANVSGYVFGGYLNHEKLPEKEFSSLRILLWEMIEDLEIEYEVEQLENTNAKFDKNLNIQGSRKHLLIHKYGHEWGIIELNLYEWELYEVINLIELATWFGEDKEYQEFVKSVNPARLDEFKWINAFDDPEGEMILENRHPKGVRILESSSL